MCVSENGLEMTKHSTKMLQFLSEQLEKFTIRGKCAFVQCPNAIFHVLLQLRMWHIEISGQASKKLLYIARYVWISIECIKKKAAQKWSLSSFISPLGSGSRFNIDFLAEACAFRCSVFWRENYACVLRNYTFSITHICHYGSCILLFSPSEKVCNFHFDYEKAHT